MKDRIKREIKAADEILKKYDMSKDDEADLLLALLNLAYEWCATNAAACAFEHEVRKEVGNDKFMDIVKKSIRNGIAEMKMEATYPRYSEIEHDRRQHDEKNGFAVIQNEILLIFERIHSVARKIGNEAIALNSDTLDNAWVSVNAAEEHMGDAYGDIEDFCFKTGRYWQGPWNSEEGAENDG